MGTSRALNHLRWGLVGFQNQACAPLGIQRNAKRSRTRRSGVGGLAQQERRTKSKRLNAVNPMSSRPPNMVERKAINISHEHGTWIVANHDKVIENVCPVRPLIVEILHTVTPQDLLPKVDMVFKRNKRHPPNRMVIRNGPPLSPKPWYFLAEQWY